MRYVDVDGLRLSVIGLGTWQFGSREWGYGETYASETAPAILRRAIELGVTLVDTAEVYGFGRSERIVGRTLGGRRDGLVVATKLMPLMPYPRIVEWQARGSARRLGVDAIDLYQVHWPNPFVSPRATMRPLRRLMEEGLVRHVGVSNHDLARWQASERALRHPVISNQVRFSLASPAPARDLVPYAHEQGRVVIAYSPLGQGLLAHGDLANGGPSRQGGASGRPAGIRRMNRLLLDRYRADVAPLLAAIREIANAHGAMPSQVALAWVIGHGRTVAIPGARTLEQLEQNVAAADLELDPAERERLTVEAERLQARLER